MEVAIGPDSYEEKEKQITALGDVQRLVMTLKEKKYDMGIIDLAEELAEEVALHDAHLDKEDKEEKGKDPRKMSLKELHAAHYDAMEKEEK